MKNAKTAALIERLKPIFEKKAEKSAKIGVKMAEKLVKSAEMRVFIKKMREFAELKYAQRTLTKE